MAKRARAIFAVATLLAGCADPTLSPAQPTLSSQSDFAVEPVRQWRLPSALDEISGLAAATDGRLFAHDDERAVLYQIDPAQGRLASTFAVGAPETGDFEGLAITPDGVFWLVTSAAELLSFREGEGGSRVAFERFDSGLRDICEVEGLAYLSADDGLILACKHMDAGDMRDQVQLYAWRPGSPASLWRSIPKRDVTEAAGVSDFQPSSVEIEASTGAFFVLSARDGAVAWFGADGSLRSAWALSAEHTQAEGLALLPDGRLVIADEGARRGALLSIYERRHD
ncbi:hypothetical protein [Terricaulis silvestris]|uniref:Uncharacterized protein n=1 Tax=Terricaulis silvestris TaxID=2686094 RepID=A0A6I6MVR9_9CAUL|nr:hypothetical protein [Terricaulis silvestris]QGZ95253.1 hypothetical protein DSM104635_02098 [Terricaulis silvestris]